MTSVETLQLPQVGTYKTDPAHTVVGFVARHLVGTKVRGRFTEFDGTITIADPVEDSTVEAVAQATSIDTGVAMRDDHLRTNDFLAAPEYPTLALKGNRLQRVDDEHWKMDVELTIRGVTKTVPFDIEYLGTGPGMAEGSVILALSASATIDRRDFGVSFNHVLNAGSLAVGNKVKIEIEVEAGLVG